MQAHSAKAIIAGIYNAAVARRNPFTIPIIHFRNIPFPLVVLAIVIIIILVKLVAFGAINGARRSTFP